MKTFVPSTAAVERKWYVVDADGMTLGRLASEVAKVLRGKNKAIFTPHLDTGDYVIIVNAENLLPSFRLCRRYERNHIERNAGKASGTRT